MSADEVSAAVLILPHMADDRPLRVRASANMALFTLGCRHGLAVCTAEGGVWDMMCSVSGRCWWKVLVDGLQDAGSVSDDALAVAGSSSTLMMLPTRPAAAAAAAL